MEQRPCFRALRREASFPSAVFGPVDFFAFSRLASIWRRVAIGDSLTVLLPSGQTLRGRVISKAAEGEFATQHDVSAAKRDIRAVAFRVAIPNPRRVLVPGMTVQVLLPTTP